MSRRWALEECRKFVVPGLWFVIALWGEAALADPGGGTLQFQVETARPASGSAVSRENGPLIRHEPILLQQVAPPAASEPETVEVLFLTLQDAAHLALSNNPEIKTERLTPLIREEEIRGERAAFHPVFTAEGSTERTEIQTSSQLAGSTTLETENIDFNSGIRTRFTTGTVASLEFLNRRTESNSSFQLLSPVYTPSLVFTLTQPLLKNFGLGVNQTRIKIAENNLRGSRHQLQLTVANILTDVENAYWELVMTLRELELRRRALELTQRLAQSTRERVAEGRLPEIALLQARTTVLEKEGDVIRAESVMKDAMKRLKDLLSLDPDANRVMVPLDQPTSDVKQIDVNQALRGALLKRPELQQAKLDRQNKNLAYHFARNHVLPQLDIFGSVGLSGLAGTPALPGQQVQTILGPTTVPSSSEGGYGTGLKNLFSGSYPTWKIGITLTIPIGNVQARSEFRKAGLDLEKAERTIAIVERRIALEVETLAYQFPSALKLIEVAKALREQVQRQLEMAQEQFQLGLVPMTAVIEAQRELTSAERGELKAIIDYNRLLALFDKTTGAILEKFRVEF